MGPSQYILKLMKSTYSLHYIISSSILNNVFNEFASYRVTVVRMYKHFGHIFITPHSFGDSKLKNVQKRLEVFKFFYDLI